MSSTTYEKRTVKILDAVAQQDFGDDDSPKFIQSLELLLKDVENGSVFRTVLEEKDVRDLVNLRDPLSSKDMIDLALLLRARSEPLTMMIPMSGDEITVSDIKKFKPKNKKRRRNKPKKS